jgi:hypothetical protein
MRKPIRQMVVCLNNEGYEASLEKRKLYVAVADDEAAKHKLVRVIDESGDDYLYPSSFFSFVELPPRIRRAVLQAA